MEIDELVEMAKAAQYSHVWVDTNALRSLIRERETLRAEIDGLKAQPAPAGHSIHGWNIFNDRIAALEDAVKDLQYGDTRHDSRLDDLIARVDEIERSHLEPGA